MTAWWALVIGPSIASALYVAVEVALARFPTPWEDAQWRWYKETGEWVQ